MNLPQTSGVEQMMQVRVLKMREKGVEYERRMLRDMLGIVARC